MKCSETARFLWAAQECVIIKNDKEHRLIADNKQLDNLLKEHGDSIERVKEYLLGCDDFQKTLEKINFYNKNAENDGQDIGCICKFDDDFPLLKPFTKDDKIPRPYLLFYKGDVSLLKDINHNIAVIGVINPSPEVIQREKKIIYQLCDELVILSGLAKGCDTVAHETCLEVSGKTIAILPTPVTGPIYPAINNRLATEIVEKGGLLLSEYYTETNDKYEKINRMITRDRLQAMFAKAIILIASYNDRKLGDFGARHAMETARKYGVDRYVMYNSDTDKDNTQFGYNRDLYENGVKNITVHTINEIKNLPNRNIQKSQDRMGGYQQLSCF